ncbi:histidine kinase dimerization/phospho-acceptor domain-containing protein [uncultured Nocardioides sp.]|uniref:sensor histidine kinase n=1 Tax=uncultured Nocardioides sp. TaxID=198441 RepID=UPI00261D72B2|nr:histidine kinase dimerization/phospho-acceptor domain-containing protein [uncultured Nocardioides sp.]
MRSRLTLAFGLLGVVVVATFILFRAVTITDLAEDDVRRQVQREALVTATLLGQGLSADQPPPSAEALGPFALPDRSVAVSIEGQGSTVATGPQWREEDRGDAITASATVEAVTVEVAAPMREVDRLVSAALPSLLALGSALVVLAVVLGALVAAGLSRPFQQLAGAANALARGRSDLRIPRTRISEARAIGTALQGGAEQLRGSLERERALALRASHELRTPLTGLRLALHELTDRDDAPPDLVEAAEVAARHVDRLDRAVGEVLEDTRNHPVVAGAQLPLSLVAPALAQRWADTLSVADVEIGAELLGDGSLVVTPGPLEQLLDEVLAAVLAHRGRAVRLALDGEERHVRATVQVLASSVHDPTPEAERALLRARAVAETLGGRIAGSLVAEDGLSVVLPRR